MAIAQPSSEASLARLSEMWEPVGAWSAEQREGTDPPLYLDFQWYTRDASSFAESASAEAHAAHAAEALERLEAAGAWGELAALYQCERTERENALRAELASQNLTPIRRLCEAEQVRLHVAAARGDDATASDAVRGLLALASATSRMPTTIAFLVAADAQSRLASEIRDAILAGHASEGLLRTFAEEWRTLGEVPAVSEYVGALKDERVAEQSSRNDRRRTGEVFAEILNAVSLPPQARAEWFESCDEPLVADLVPALEKMAETRTGLDLRVRATLIMCELEHIRREAGRYPGELPEPVAHLAADPFAPGTRLRYVLVSPDAPTANVAYHLYSVGFDGVDNGGVFSKYDDGSTERDAPHGQGKDLWLNRPR